MFENSDADDAEAMVTAYGDTGRVGFGFFMRHGYFQTAIAPASLEFMVATRALVERNLSEAARDIYREEAVRQALMAPDFRKLARAEILAACVTVYVIATETHPVDENDPFTDIFAAETIEGMGDDRIGAIAFNAYRASDAGPAREQAHLFKQAYEPANANQ